MPFLQRFELCVTVSVAGYVQPALFEFELSWCRRLNRATPHTIKSGANLRHSFVTNYRSAACSNVLEILRACKANHHGRDTGYHQEAVKAMSPSVTIVSVGQKPDTDASAKYTNYSQEVASTRWYGGITLEIESNGEMSWATSKQRCDQPEGHGCPGRAIHAEPLAKAGPPREAYPGGWLARRALRPRKTMSNIVEQVADGALLVVFTAGLVAVAIGFNNAASVPRWH